MTQEVVSQPRRGGKNTMLKRLAGEFILEGVTVTPTQERFLIETPKGIKINVTLNPVTGGVLITDKDGRDSFIFASNLSETTLERWDDVATAIRAATEFIRQQKRTGVKWHGK